MTRSRASRRGRSLHRAAAAAIALGLATAALGGPTSAVSAPLVGGPGCPEPMPVVQLAEGQPVTGLTVSRGTTPEPITGSVLGVLGNGIAPGIDMILVELTSPEIDRVGGIWSGMSGSPVYAEDGRLLGAVAYGLTWGSSPVAGVTPAAEMQRLLTDPGPTAEPPARVQVPRRMARSMADSGAATRAQTEAGLSRLTVPVAISGMAGTERLELAAERLDLEGVRVHATGSAGVTEGGDATSIVPGGNIGASWAYGDFSAVATGTVTAVCGDQVLAFGHPMSFTGATTLTMHSADAVYVQEDTTGAAFKITNPTGTVGTVDQDRLAAIKGFLGQVPSTSAVTTQVSSEQSGFARTGETRVSVPSFLADATAMALLANQDRVFDQIGEGSAEMRFEVSGVDADGDAFLLERSNRFVSEWDVSYETVAEVAGAVATIVDNRFTDVTVDEVTVTSLLSDLTPVSRLRGVALKRGGAWVPLVKRDVIRVRAGKKIRLRTTVVTASGESVDRRLVVPVPRKAARSPRGELRVLAGERLRWASGERPGSFSELLEGIAEAPRNDELHALLELYGERRESVVVQRSTLLDEVGKGQRSYRVRVTG